VVDLGDAVLTTDDSDDLEDALVSTIEAPTGFPGGIDPTILGDGLFQLDVVLVETAFDCGGADPDAVPAASPPSFGPFTFSVDFPLAEGGTLACSGEYPVTVWQAFLNGADLADDAQLTWTDAESEPAQNDGSAASDAAIAAREAAAVASPIDCTGTTEVSAPAPVSVLTLTCDPAVAAPGQVVTCTVTGGDPGIEILWRASASPAFAGAGVQLDAEGHGTFSFRVPTSIGTRPITVELVGWGRTAPVAVVAPPVPVSVQAGEGAPQDRLPVPATAVLLLGAAGLLGLRRASASR